MRPKSHRAVVGPLAVAVAATLGLAVTTTAAASPPLPAKASKPAKASQPAKSGAHHAHSGKPAAGKPGSALGSVSVNATAAAVRAPFYSSSGEDVEGEVPFASSTLASGLAGEAVTSVAWPGGTGANGGTTLYLLGPQCVPPNPTGLLPLPCPTTLPQGPQSGYNKLNDTEKAQAQTGSGKPTDTHNGPGFKQTATAKPTLISSATNVSGSSAPSVSETFGKTSASTIVKVTGPKTVVATATSSAHNVSLAKGLIKFGAVTSVAHAVSNTKTAKGTATTTVSNASIAGVPVTIDESGVHLKGSKAPLPATSVVNKALNGAGIQIFFAKPTKQVNKASVTVNSGNLIVLFNQSQYVKNANDTGALLILGAASIGENTGKGTVPQPIPSPTAPPPSTPPSAHSGPTGSTPTGGTGGSVSVGGTTGGGSGQQPAVAGPGSQLASSGLQLPSGWQLAWLIVGLVVAGAVAFALKRLPDRMLATTATTCPLEDTSP